MKNRQHYRAIFISDTHLGFRGAKAKNLLSFLKSVECHYLYLVGDIVDLWEMKKGILWDLDSSSVIRRIMKMSQDGTKVVYVPGNHDEAIRHFLPFEMAENVSFCDETFHTTSNGTKFNIIHGDQFDFVIGHMKWLAVLGTTLYDWLLSLNDVLHSVRVRLGYHTYWSLAGYLKHKAKGAVSFMRDFETAVVHHAKKQECDGVVCGHIHRAKLEMIDGIQYANCGDWVESLTALVEDVDGRLRLIHWHDLD